MQFLVLRLLRHNELGMFHGYRRAGKERAKQRAINFDAPVVHRLFPTASDGDKLPLILRYQTDTGVSEKLHTLKRQTKNWRLEGNCPVDHCYDFVEPGCLFALMVDTGTRPARGAWAVYPERHPITERILAHAESGRLVGEPMVSLHRTEGSHTLLLLQKSSPELFGNPELSLKDGDIEGMKEVRQVKTQAKRIRLRPRAARTANLLAEVGHTLPSAVADVVDNAISAEATLVEIKFGRPDEGHGRWMTITDNGRGMSQSELEEAMTVGSLVQYDSRALGKYGYGLKGASWSQTDRFTVLTKRNGKRACNISWDMQDMDDWEAIIEPLSPWEREVMKLGDQGTCVLWHDMHPPLAMPTAPGVEPYTAEVLELERHLALVFHRFIEGKAAGRSKIRLRVNGKAVAANNPVGHVKTTSYDRKTVRVPTPLGDAFVQVQGFLLPSEQEIKELRGKNAEAIRDDLDKIGLYGRRNESQGIYVYRNDRLIQWGGWHNIWSTNDEKTKLARVTVDFDDELDKQFDVNITKRIVTLSHQVKDEIKKIAVIARADSKRKFSLSGTQASSSTSTSKSAKLTQVTRSQAADSREASATTAVAGGGSQARGTTQGATAKLPIRHVRTTTFAWKLISNMKGKTELQISEGERALQALVAAVRRDNEAMLALSAFLQRLDDAGVQTLLADAGGAA